MNTVESLAQAELKIEHWRVRAVKAEAENAELRLLVGKLGLQRDELAHDRKRWLNSDNGKA